MRKYARYKQDREGIKSNKKNYLQGMQQNFFPTLMRWKTLTARVIVHMRAYYLCKYMIFVCVKRLPCVQGTHWVLRNTSVQGDLFFGLMPVFVCGIPRAGGVNCVLSVAMVDSVRDRLQSGYLRYFEKARACSLWKRSALW